MTKHRCVITGATGYIGSHLAKHLLSLGWEVHAITRAGSSHALLEDVKDDITLFEYSGDITSLAAYFRQVQPEVVFHLAASVLTSYLPGQIPALVQGNVQFGTEVLEAMRQCSSRLFVNTGTYWQNYNSAEYNPVDLYAATKEAFEKILKYYVEAHQFRAVTLRLYDVYGEDDKRPKLLNLLKAIAGTEKVIDISPGEQYLDMVHISDVCAAYVKAYEWLVAHPMVRNETYGVYTNQEIQLKEMIALFARILGKDIHVNIGGKTYKSREVMNPMKPYACLPNWHYRINVKDGLKLFDKLGGVKLAELSCPLNLAA